MRCPVRALREYLHRTHPLRDGCPRVFVSLKEPSCPLAKSSISAYSKRIIMKAIQEMDKEHFQLLMPRGTAVAIFLI